MSRRACAIDARPRPAVRVNPLVSTQSSVRCSAVLAFMFVPESPKSEEVEHLLRNAQLRDELEPLFDESIDRVNPTAMSTRSENEFLESMLEWERAPMLPISQWFDPPLVLPHPDRLGQHQLSLVLRATIEKLFEKHVVLGFHRSPERLPALRPDLPRHSAVARKEARTPHELSALGLCEHRREPGYLAALLRERRPSARCGPRKTISRCRRTTSRRSNGKCRGRRCRCRRCRAAVSLRV